MSAPRPRVAPGPRGKPELPRTLTEAVDQIVDRLSEKDKGLVRSTPREDLIRFHHGWGMGIRNGFGLWGQNPDLIADLGTGLDADAGSMKIIEAVWERLRGS